MIRLSRLFGVALAVAAAAPVVRAQVPAVPAPPAEVPPATPPAADAPPAVPPPAADVPPVVPPPADGAAAIPGPATTPSAPAIPADQTLAQNAQSFFHYIALGSFDLANSNAQQLLGRDTAQVAAALEEEARKRNGTDIDTFLLRAQDVPPLKASVAALSVKLNEGRLLRFRDPAWIRQNVTKLGGNPRQQSLAVAQLRQSGELAVPMMIDFLRDPTQAALHPGIREGMRQLGTKVLNPLAAATEMRDDPTTLAAVADVLAQIRQADAVPYLLRVVQDKNTPPQVRAAVTASLQRMEADGRAGAGDLFYALAEKFYYRSAALSYDTRLPTAFVWTWDNDRHQLTHKDVPPGVWHDVMAMRTAEAALRQGTRQEPGAFSLWLAANNKRETDLKEGESSNLYADAPAHFYNVRSGVQYVNNVLGRALRDQNTAVALKAVRSLQEIVGRANFTGGESPLLTALRYPDVRVRYEAAIAVGTALPNTPFPGQEQVVQLLADAVTQNGTGGILILAPTDAARGELGSQFKNYAVAGGTTANYVVGESARLPSVDVIVVSDQSDPEQVRQLVAAASTTPRLQRAAKLFLVRSSGSPWFRQAMTDMTTSATLATTGDPLLKAVEDARGRAAGGTLDEKGAGEFALRAASLLNRLAVAKGTVLDLSLAERTLLGALNDARPDVVKVVAGVLGQTGSRTAQAALVDKAGLEATSEDVRVAAYKAAANSAKLYGNLLDAGRVESLRRVVRGSASQDVKNAAAETLGALNLPVEQIKSLILDRPAPTTAPATQPAAAPAGETPAAPATPATPDATPAVPAPVTPEATPATPAVPATPEAAPVTPPPATPDGNK